MAGFPSKKIKKFIREGDEAQTSAAKGAAWESLVALLVELIPGIKVTHRNVLNVTQSEEIDIAVWNEGAPRGLKGLPLIIFIEVKNWSAPVDAQHIMVFNQKLLGRGLSFGILVAAGGITGDPVALTAAHAIPEHALQQGRQIVVITRHEIEALKSAEDLVVLIKKKVCALVASGTSLAALD